MSAPALSRRPEPAPVLAVDAAELSRFRSWLLARGYADRTAGTWARAVRLARARGAGGAGEVDEYFGGLRQNSRGVIRAALREYDEFREAGR